MNTRKAIGLTLIATGATLFAVMAWQAKAQSGPKDAVTPPPVMIDVCGPIYAKYPKYPRNAGVLNLLYRDLGCTWESRDRKPEQRPEPTPRPEPEMCRTEIKGEIVYGNCGERK